MVSLAYARTTPEEKKMNKFIKTSGAALVICIVFATVSACQKEGPAERAGKEVDKTVEKVGQQIEKAGESIQDATKGGKK